MYYLINIAQNIYVYYTSTYYINIITLQYYYVNKIFKKSFQIEA